MRWFCEGLSGKQRLNESRSTRPMLSFIPMAIFGGLQLPSPWDSGYNHATPVAGATPAKEPPFLLESAGPI